MSTKWTVWIISITIAVVTRRLVQPPDTGSSSSTDQVQLSASENTATTPQQSNLQTQQLQQLQQPQPKEEDDASNEVVDNCDSDYIVNPFFNADTIEYSKKYERYKDDYLRWIHAKYFSKKSMNGVNIFDEETTIEDEVIKSSRLPPIQSFIDPTQTAEDQSKTSTSNAETSTGAASRKNQSKKSS